ncbi:FAD-dependent monooxygenase [Streptomyces sp. NBC_01276]|uniref:FAD-dependent monooxygenase n=1 Tax=Streptomyces sp. NBC_01276 TaxID=2903808 RepID=UPI00352F34FF
MSVAETEVDVLIVGAGPVGLTARALLERWGVPTLLVEKRRALSPFPRSRLVNARSMEIYRQLGLADGIAARAFAPEFGRIRFRDTFCAGDFATAPMAGVNAPVPESPVIGVVTSQDRLEPVLLAAAEARVRFAVELVGLAEGPRDVLATLVDHRHGGARSRVRARYVLAADGADSPVRRRLGIGTTGPGALGAFTTVVFDADLGRWCADRPAGVYFTAHGSFAPLYPEGGWAWFGPTPEDPADVDWPALLARALGPGDGVRADVLRVQHWVMNAFVAERLRSGRILLAGDAAHAVPVFGGLGMNTGLADVHNLCWKLAGVLRGWAGPGVLDTYEPERLPVAGRTLRRTVANTRRALDVQGRRREQRTAGGPAARPGEVELPWSEGFFAQLGLVLGVAYRSGAVLGGDGTAPDADDVATGDTDGGHTHDADDTDDADGADDADTHYVPTAEPGHRMPHLWLTRDRSTLDAFGPWFTLLTADPALWARQIAPSWPLRIEPLRGEHAQRCGLAPHGALLVRPDGHIGARWRGRPPSATSLHDALTTITSAPRP